MATSDTQLLDSMANFEAAAVRVAGMGSSRNGVYMAVGVRNGRFAFDRRCVASGTASGALFFDGRHWKCCERGGGMIEAGWDFSQLEKDVGEIVAGLHHQHQHHQQQQQQQQKQHSSKKESSKMDSKIEIFLPPLGKWHRSRSVATEVPVDYSSVSVSRVSAG